MRAMVMLFAWLLASCAGATVGRQSPTTGTTVTAPDGSEVDVAEAAWSQRAQAQEAARAIELWSQRVNADATDAEAWLRLAQAHHFVATVHAGEPADVIEHTRAGLDAAQHALTLIAPDVAERFATRVVADASVPSASVPALYWRARNHAALAAAQGYAEVLVVDPEVGDLLSICERLQPEYDHHGAVVLLAQRMANPIDVTRRDLPNARTLFARVLNAEPTYLPHRVALAEHYAIMAGDRALFEHELTETRNVVLPTDANAEQHIAQQRAQLLHSQIDELFE